MWFLVQTNEDGKKKKFMCANNYDTMLEYINKYDQVKKYDDYNYASYNDEELLLFHIYLGEKLGDLYNNDKRKGKKNYGKNR